MGERRVRTVVCLRHQAASASPRARWCRYRRDGGEGAGGVAVAGAHRGDRDAHDAGDDHVPGATAVNPVAGRTYRGRGTASLSSVSGRSCGGVAIADGEVEYTSLHVDSTNLKARKTYLHHSARGTQPYEQLAAFYRRIGRDRDARAVQLAAVTMPMVPMPITISVPPMIRPSAVTGNRSP